MISSLNLLEDFTITGGKSLLFGSKELMEGKSVCVVYTSSKRPSDDDKITG